MVTWVNMAASQRPQDLLKLTSPRLDERRNSIKLSSQ